MSANTIQRRQRRADASSRTPLGWALGLPALRIAMLAVATGLAWLIVGATVGWTAFPPQLVAVVAMIPVNVLSLLLVSRRLRREGRSPWELIGIRRGKVGRDILWGVLWLVVLWVPFAFTVAGVVWALHGAAAPAAFETVFFDPAAALPIPPAVAFSLALLGVLTFAPLNAPAEELVYRGYAQGGLAQRWPAPLAIAVSAVLFGAQHVWFATTPAALVVYACAFTVWGAGAGIIAWRQRRLFPLIVAHFLVNLLLTLPALAVPFLPALANGAS